jgi:hypothetical protein
MNPMTTIELSRDGNQWCALVGENLQEGAAGYGDTVADALRNLAEQPDLLKYVNTD